MRKVFMLPTPSNAINDTSNSINQIVLRLRQQLPAYGYELTENEDEADLIAGHAGASSRRKIDVAHCHGLYPTAESGGPPWYWAANREVIGNLRSAKAITVPSQWVAEMLRRDMHIEPNVIPWAVDGGDWDGVRPPGKYVLWGKTRPDGVCSPATMTALARAVPEQQFVATFSDINPPANLTVIGRRPFNEIKAIIQSAGVYLADVKETFGIMTLEAMACGVPVLGFNWGGTADLVEHGVDGYLVEPGDIDGLAVGLAYCQQHRGVLGANARKKALRYTWNETARQIAAVYDSVLTPHVGPKVSVVIPLHNYARWVGEAINSVKAQQTSFDVEVIIVEDSSTDESYNAALAAVEDWSQQARVERVRYGSVSRTRNHGIAMARGEYVVCLDADDRIGHPSFLSSLAAALDNDHALAVVYTGLTVIDESGALGAVSPWPNGYDFDMQVKGRNQVPTCCMFRRDAWERAGGYRKAYEPSEDARLWLLIGANGGGAAQVTTEGWFQYRQHEGSLSDSIRKGQRPEPPWRAALAWVEDGKRPFAAGGEPTPNRHSWPVRNYDRPLVTAIIPVGPGHELYLPEALDSLEAQNDRRWTAIVINDTGAPLSLAGWPWARIIDTKGKVGAAAARNIGIRAATTKLITFLDADDILEPRFLEQTIRAATKAARYAYTDWVSLNKEGRFEKHETPEYVEGDPFMKSTIHAINVMLPRAWALDVGGFDETMDSWEDVEFFMKLAAKGYCGVRVPEPLLIYRYTTGNLRERGEGKKEALKALLRDRYHDFIVGGKHTMCCGTPPVQPSGPPLPPEQAKLVAGGEYARVEYTGPRVAVGAHTLIGGATGKNYGQRGRGEVFIVYRADLLANPDRFVEAQNAVLQPEVTPVPAPPVLR